MVALLVMTAVPPLTVMSPLALRIPLALFKVPVGLTVIAPVPVVSVPALVSSARLVAPLMAPMLSVDAPLWTKVDPAPAMASTLPAAVPTAVLPAAVMSLPALMLSCAPITETGLDPSAMFSVLLPDAGADNVNDPPETLMLPTVYDREAEVSARK